MKPCHSHVIKPGDAVAQHLGGDSGLFRNAHVAGAAGGHHNGTTALDRLRQGNRQPCQRFIAQRELLFQRLRHIRTDTGNQDIDAAPPAHGFQNAADLLRGLGLTVDDLGHSLADGPVIVYLCVSQILKGSQLQPQQGVLRRERPVPDLLQDRENIVLDSHRSHRLSLTPPARDQIQSYQGKDRGEPGKNGLPVLAGIGKLILLHL